MASAFEGFDAGDGHAILAAAQPDTTGAASEASDIPLTIQPYLALLVFDPAMRRVTHYSANLPALLGLQDDFVRKSADDILGAEAAGRIRVALAAEPQARRPVLFFQMRFGGRHDGFDVSVFDGSAGVVLSIETAPPNSRSDTHLLSLRALIDRVRAIQSAQELFDTVASLVRETFGYDRVQFFRIQRDRSTIIVGESRNDALPSLLGECFSDGGMPTQREAPYPGTQLRLISDAHYVPVPVVPARSRPHALPVDAPACDRTSSLFPCEHCEYLACLGAEASMSNTLIVDGQVWGGILCHHSQPKTLTLAQRVTVKMFGEYLALQIMTLLRTNRLRSTQKTVTFIDGFLKNAVGVGDLPANLRGQLPKLAGFVPCDGCALWVGGEWTAHGDTPSSAVMEAFIALAMRKAGSQVWHTRHLAGVMPALRNHFSLAGVLIIPVSADPGDYLFLFRREVAQTFLRIKRRPHDDAGMCVPDGETQLVRSCSPLVLEKQSVSEQSVVWTDEECEIAGLLRSALIEVMGAYYQRLLAEGVANDARLKLLNGELTHRVKNILAVVQSLITQPAPPGRSSREHLRHLRGRVQALSHAHDQIVQTGGGGMLREILECELEPYRNDSRRIVMEGQPVWLGGEALSIVALTLHELATNAAKYGAFRNPEGRVHISWHQADAQSMLFLDWRETGGPVVEAPGRNGFGMTLIERGIIHDLGGSTTIHHDPTGLRVCLGIPSRYTRVAAETLPESVRSDGGMPRWWTDRTEDSGEAGDKPALAGLDILLLEDQILIALAAEQDLLEKGARSVYPTNSVSEALACLQKTAPHVAVLDVNLGEGTCEDVATLLQARGIPYVLASGYLDVDHLPESLRSAPMIGKPYTIDDLSSAITRLVYGGDDR